MAAPQYVPSTLDEQPRKGLAVPPASGWVATRPGDLVGQQPVGPRLGRPGPDQGYALRLVRRFEDKLVLVEPESRADAIAGCIVRSGLINRQSRVRVVRDGVEVYEGTISSLKRFKDDVREVREGFECGIGVENFNDIKVGDVLECYRKEQVARTLTSAAGASA